MTITGERGSVAVEAVVITPVLLMMLFLVVYAGRVSQADIDVRHAAAAAARAASLRADPAAATETGQRVAAANLTAAGVACQRLTVEVDATRFAPGGTVTVTVECEASLRDLVLLGVPGSRPFRAQSVEVIDVYRGTTDDGSQ